MVEEIDDAYHPVQQTATIIGVSIPFDPVIKDSSEAEQLDAKLFPLFWV